MAQQTAPASAPASGATKYNKNKDLIKGEINLVYIGGIPVAYAKKDDFKFTPSQIDVASKFSGKYGDKMGGINEWSISIEAFVSSGENHMSYDALENIAASGKAIAFEICKSTVTDANGERTITKVSGGTIRQGMVTISDLSKSSPNGEYETCTCTLNGSGPLKDGEGNEIGSKEAIAALGITLS